MAVLYAREIQATFAHSQYPDTPQHDAQSYGVCNVQGSNDWIYRAFLKHDISSIPYKSTIIRAELFVYCCYHHDHAAASTHNLTRVTEDWDETTLTWNNMPEQNSQLYLEEAALPPAVDSWGSWDITRMVQEWVNGTYPNYGLQFVNNDEGAYRTEWRFWNRRWENGLESYIKIEYEPALEYRITNARMKELAAQVRRITGRTDALTVQDMAAELAQIE